MFESDPDSRNGRAVNRVDAPYLCNPNMAPFGPVTLCPVGRHVQTNIVGASLHRLC